MVQPSERIPVSIITGFLGAGKSTLLNRLLRDPGMRDTAETEAIYGTLEAITRAARNQLGGQLLHTSGRTRADSRYLRLPDGREVRLSNHEIPITPQREYQRSLSGGPRWSAEHIVDRSNWHMPLEWWLSQIRGAP